MEPKESIEVKFRLSNGTDIGPNKYDPSTSVASLKEIVVSKWPQDLKNGPKAISDMKLINGGKILDNNRTLAESQVPVVDIPGGVITMHVVVQPTLPDKNNEKQNMQNQSSCGCACCIM